MAQTQILHQFGPTNTSPQQCKRQSMLCQKFKSGKYGKKIYRNNVTCQVFQLEKEHKALQQPKYNLSFAGGGIYFFWQLGVAKYLQNIVDLNQISITGASSGALVAGLVGSGVDLDTAVESAYQLSMDNNIWDRPLGVIGIWGPIIREWLYQLLPEDAVTSCRDRIEIILLEIPSFQQVLVSDYLTKDELVDALLASAHVPFLLDGNLAVQFRGKRYMDGSIPDFIRYENSPLLVQDGNAVVVDYSQDERLKAERLDFLRLREYKEILHMIDLGYDYGKQLHSQGDLDQLIQTSSNYSYSKF
eukprot:TRINITY_DN4597_c0_g1_i1.p1 TRINITY_DN4597_c0_g1~~TRINITY_DN4597_c0_g1_i1.p1  ORF type:complete len:302 (+),score=26.67 TRINITY_DN4597_c0_g1_i1:91-996(+)